MIVKEGELQLNFRMYPMLLIMMLNKGFSLTTRNLKRYRFIPYFYPDMGVGSLPTPTCIEKIKLGCALGGGETTER